jgi:serine/threonine protein kinase
VRADEHIDTEGNIKEPEYRDDDSQFGDLWQGVRFAKPKDMSEAEAKLFHDLLLKMLDYEAGKRLSTREVLEHPWFTTESF